METVITDKMVVACNGNDGALGHPKVYLNLAPSGKAECPYCSRLYVNRSAASEVASDAAAPQGEG